MPAYDYKCSKCDTVFEVSHGFDDKPPKTCLAKGCRGKLKRMFSPPAIIFKGKGWHVNDYASSSSKPGGNGGNGKDSDKVEKTIEKATEKADKTTEKAKAKKDN